MAESTVAAKAPIAIDVEVAAARRLAPQARLSARGLRRM
jgi:hypothetical protein